MPEFCRVERDGRLFTVTIDRPQVMNALHPPANFELEKVFDEFVADPDLWVAIITGAGDRAFSAGNDLKVQASAGEGIEIAPTGFAGLTSRFDDAKPVIAAVNGLALGGGFEIALACDLLIASQNASFGLPEPRVGLAAMAGGMHRLPRQIPLDGTPRVGAGRPGPGLRQRGGCARAPDGGGAPLGGSDPRMRPTQRSRVEAVRLAGPRAGGTRGSHGGPLPGAARDDQERGLHRRQGR
jgi:hypothetical protein